jgi:hypothetical protein
LSRPDFTVALIAYIGFSLSLPSHSAVAHLSAARLLHSFCDGTFLQLTWSGARGGAEFGDRSVPCSNTRCYNV